MLAEMFPAPLSPHHPQETIDDMGEYLAGLVYGMTGHDHHFEIDHCLMLQDPAEVKHLQ